MEMLKNEENFMFIQEKQANSTENKLLTER